MLETVKGASNGIAFFFTGWMIHYIPFFFMTRQVNLEIHLFFNLSYFYIITYQRFILVS